MFDNNVTDSSYQMINHDFFENNLEVKIYPAPPCQNLDHGISLSSIASGSGMFEKWAIKDEVLKAEIVFMIYNVVNYHSFNS